MACHGSLRALLLRPDAAYGMLRFPQLLLRPDTACGAWQFSQSTAEARHSSWHARSVAEPRLYLKLHPQPDIMARTLPAPEGFPSCGVAHVLVCATA